MGKRIPKSKKSLSASASAEKTTKLAEKEELLKLKSTEKMKRTARKITVSEKEKKPISSKKPKAKPKKKTKREDANKPKKPPTAFFYFLEDLHKGFHEQNTAVKEDFRKDYQEQNPDVKSMRDIGKACGEKWKIMTYEEKVKYYDIATVKRAEFDEAMANYTKRKESGEDEESDDDTDFD